MSKYLDDQYNIVLFYEEHDLYRIIAERLVNDDGTYKANLLLDPRNVFKNTLNQIGITVPEEIIDALVARLRRFVKEEEEVMLLPATQDYLDRFKGQGPTNVV